jgi:hypothetical protein
MKRSTIFLITFSTIIAFCGLSSGTTIHVGLGGSYTYNNIQAGISAAYNGDTVIVHDGTYTGTGNRNIDFGGRNITLRSANGWQNTTINLQGSSRAFYFHSGETRNSVIDGFNVINGVTSGGGTAILCDNSSSPTIKNSRFYNNLTSGDTKGGAISFNSNSDGALINCIFDKNEARHGGGVCAQTGSDIDVFNCLFQNNNSRYDGGGLWTHSSNVDVGSSIFRLNTGGAGIRFDDNSNSVTNCLFYKNSSTYAGGIRQDAGHLTIRNSTIADNILADGFGGGVFIGATGILTMLNSIVWGNDHDSIYLYEQATIDSITYSDLEGGWTGLGNINADPLFLDALNGNYKIRGWSPAVDAAPDIGVYFDLDGNLRPYNVKWINHGGVFDMGAYEVIPEPSTMLLLVSGIIVFIARKKR